MTTGKARLRAAFVSLLALAAWSGAAIAAVSLTNRDDKDHKLTVVEDGGAKTTEHNLKPMQVLEGICPKGCIIRLNDSEADEYELEPGDKVSIEEGYLYYDEPESGQQQGTGTAPAAPGAAPAEPKKN